MYLFEKKKSAVSYQKANCIVDNNGVFCERKKISNSDNSSLQQLKNKASPRVDWEESAKKKR